MIMALTIFKRTAMQNGELCTIAGGKWGLQKAKLQEKLNFGELVRSFATSKKNNLLSKPDCAVVWWVFQKDSAFIFTHCKQSLSNTAWIDGQLNKEK